MVGNLRADDRLLRCKQYQPLLRIIRDVSLRCYRQNLTGPRPEVRCTVKRVGLWPRFAIDQIPSSLQDSTLQHRRRFGALVVTGILGTMGNEVPNRDRAG